ncbi:MAG: hypothetical protein IH623_23815 [Verrucomicrobia bacterium]|nr:hypothetical protein [Verrucomicrobiota bacterium]
MNIIEGTGMIPCPAANGSQFPYQTVSPALPKAMAEMTHILKVALRMTAETGLSNDGSESD